MKIVILWVLATFCAIAGWAQDANTLMAEAMKKQGMSQKEIDQALQLLKQVKGTQTGLSGRTKVPGTIPALPQRPPGLVLRKLDSRAAFTPFIQSLLKDIVQQGDKQVIAAVDKAMAAHQNSLEDLSNLVPFYLMKGSSQAALYAGIKLAASHSDNLILNNLGVTLLQTGHADKAVPVLEYLSQQCKAPDVLNNLGQSYLSLGDTAAARRYFMACLAQSSGHNEANCGIGYIDIEEGNFSAAATHLKVAMMGGFSPLAAALLKQGRIAPDANALGFPMPSKRYFNFAKYQPLGPIEKANEYDSIFALHEQLASLHGQFEAKAEQAKKAKPDQQELNAGADLARTYLSGAPFAWKSYYVMQNLPLLLTEYRQELERIKIKAVAENAEFRKKVEAYRATKQVDCDGLNAIQDAYLHETAVPMRQFINRWKATLIDYFNRELFFSYYAFGDAHYEAAFYSAIEGYFQELLWITELQPYQFIQPCVHSKFNDKADSAGLKISCPMKFIIKAGIMKFKFDCKSFEIEGGEGIVGSLEADMRSGEFTVGVGVGMGMNTSPVDVGLSEKFIFKFDSQHNLADIGMKMEGGVEGSAGPLVFERTISGTLTLKSGVQGSATDLVTGHEVSFKP